MKGGLALLSPERGSPFQGPLVSPWIRTETQLLAPPLAKLPGPAWQPWKGEGPGCHPQDKPTGLAAPWWPKRLPSAAGRYDSHRSDSQTLESVSPADPRVDTR